MWGQWRGVIEGTNSGLVMMNIDKDRPDSGTLSVYDADPSKVALLANIDFKFSEGKYVGNINNFQPYPHPKTKEELESVSKTQRIPSMCDVEFELEGKKLKGFWETDVGTSGELHLDKMENNIAYDPDDIKPWDEFKQWVIEEKNKTPGFIFRGHTDNSYPLRTTFHRMSRRNFTRYGFEDVPELQRNVASVIGRTYKLSDPEEYGELLFLAQHHGFPTPLLDWTKSPYVAAYFAFAGLDKMKDHSNSKVRIHMFDMEAWHNKYSRAAAIDEVKPYFSAHIMNSRDNRRAIPQQSVVTFSNIYNVEEYIRFHEKIDMVQYLRIIDIDASDRNKAMKDLQYMGITAASLFPSLDGTCTSLKEIQF